MRTAPAAVGLLGLVRILLLFESSLYSAVVPVLPHYAHLVHASKPAVGVLAAAYSAGVIPGSLLGGWLAGRVGVRMTTVLGLSVFAVAAAAFGFATTIVGLDVLRFIQGIACGGIWGGALTWVIAVTPRERRGAMLGSVIAAATFGTLIGPLLGTLAVTAGTEIVFSAVGALSVLLAFWASLYPQPAVVAPKPRRPRRRVPLTGALLLGTWLIALEALAFGAGNALLPLRLAHLGAAETVIGAAFLGAAGLGTVVAPAIGHLTDRRGARLPICAGLLMSAFLIPALALPHSSALLAVLCVLAFGGPLTLYMTPAVAVMTSSAERAGISIVLVTTLFNLAYAAGETVGAPAAAVLSQQSGDALPLILLGGLMLLTLVPVWRMDRGARPEQPDQPSTGSSVMSRATSAA